MMTEDKKFSAFTDLDLMFFGRFKGTVLQDVSANYLMWWYNEANGRQYVGKQVDATTSLYLKDLIKLANYIHNSMDVLKMEIGE